MKFRKKPVVVEAMLFDGDNWLNISDWCKGEVAIQKAKRCIVVHTIDGSMRADPGDWIIKGIKGEFYPCKNDVFEQSYEPVEE